MGNEFLDLLEDEDLKAVSLEVSERLPLPLEELKSTSPELYDTLMKIREMASNLKGEPEEDGTD